MARYIDADALKERLEDFSKWCRDGRKQGVDFVLDCPLPNMPTADFAPRAEIDKLQEVNADLNESLRLAAEANKDLQAAIAEVRAEVAREIFEEIEKHLFVIAPIEEFDGWARIQLADIMRLKKKHTQPEPPKGE